jgi:hypothetical protein
MSTSVGPAQPLSEDERLLLRRYFREVVGTRIRRAVKVSAAVAGTAFALTLPLAHAPIHEMFLVWFVGLFLLLAGWSVLAILVSGAAIE